jgi:PAS domain S-box-containing protein
MNAWPDNLLAFSASPELAALLLSGHPAWVWTRDGSRILWANPVGGIRLGVTSFRVLAERRWPERHPLRRAVDSLARTMPAAGTLARLRLVDDLHSVPIGCRCRPVRAGETRGVLVTTEGVAPAPSLEALAAFFSDDDVVAVIRDSAGALLAKGGSATETAHSDAPHVTLDAGGRALRLYLVESATRAPEPPPRQAASALPAAAPFATANDVAAVDADRDRLHAGEVPKPKSRPIREIELRPRFASPRQAGSAPAPASHRMLAEQEVADEAERQPSQAGPAHVTAGRVPRELSRSPVRFLWQTDAANRVLFVSPGLAQVVGRNAEIVGEHWQGASDRLQLDPTGRIGKALGHRDTWSGLTAWWPIEGSNVRVPVELTALPVFGSDHSFQGYRGFGVLRPAEALMPAAFEARFGAVPKSMLRPAQQLPPYEEAVATAAANVVPIRADIEPMGEQTRLSPQERSAFEEIAAALRSRVAGEFSGPSDDAAPDSNEVAPERNFRPIETQPAPARPPTRPAPDAQVTNPSAQSAEDAARGPGTLRTRLAEAERRLHDLSSILDTATDGVVILDAAGVIESVNASAEALFGLEAQEMLGVSFGDLFTPGSRQLALDYLSGLRDSGVASLLNEGRELEARAGSGSIPLFMTMGRVSSDEGERYCAVLRDITHWKRSEAELLAARGAAEEASKQKSDFLARVSHEIRTPLNAIIGFAEVMIEERFGPIENDRYREYLRDIRTSGEHVVSLVNDLLDISKIEAGKLDMHFGAVPLNDLVRECIGLMQPQANRAHVVLRSSLSREVPAIVADARTLRQIVLNLLSNSIKFNGPGGQVIASTSLTDGGEALLRVRDTGEGMSDAELVRAMEPFRQLSTAPLADRTGSGLGLPLTKALVEANRAAMTIRSARGEGTVVTVTFPPTRVLSE